MGFDEKIKRINELYHKSQKGALTDEEKLEQAKLRAEYTTFPYRRRTAVLQILGRSSGNRRHNQNIKI